MQSTAFGKMPFTKLLRIMKVSALLLLLALQTLARPTASAQVTLKEKSASLEKILRSIQKQSNYSLSFDEILLKEKGKPVAISVDNVPVEEAVAIVTKTQDQLEVILNGHIISVREKKPAPPAVLSQGLNPMLPPPPPIDISGKITDKDGNPLNGASVKVKGTNRGTTTALDGVFVLKGIEGNAVLEISFVGYETTTVAVNNKTSIIASLNAATQSLQDVVVSKGYYSTTQRLNTGDVTKVSGDDIRKQPVTDFIQALEGKVAGLDIQQASGIPGAYGAVRIRGQNSMDNGNDPLYIIDGVPFGSASMSSTFFATSLGQPSSLVSNGKGNPVNSNGKNGGEGMSPFNSLNTSDIESIEVLKDADATAIYGSRGANGVILITTKKGKAGKSQGELNMQQGWGKVTRMMNLLNTQQYLVMKREAFNNDGFSSFLVPQFASNFPDLLFWDTTRYTDWQKVLIGNTAKYSNIQGSLSGGTVNTQFLISGGYSNQGTVFPGNYSDQHASAHFNLTHASENKRFHALFTMDYGYAISNLPHFDFTQYITTAPDAPAPYNKDGSLNWQPLNGAQTWNNPLATTFDQDKAITTTLVSNLSIGYELVKGLTLKSSFGYSRSQMDQSNLQPSSAAAPPNNNNPTSRSTSFAVNEVSTWIIEPQINYKAKLGKGQLDALVGGTFQENVSNSLSQRASGFSSDALINNPVAATTSVLIGKAYADYHYEAIYGRVGYNWEEKYLLNITARRDGSSRFGPRKQFGNFGAIGAGWIFSKESFFRNVSFISFGKLRVSYGTTGSDQIPDYRYLSLYAPQSSSYLGVTGLQPTSLTNPDFAWEINKKLEGGLDIGLMKDRINLSVSYYQNRSSNQLLPYSLPFLTGFSGVYENLPATVQNTGWEFTITTRNIETKDFKWTSSANLTILRNKLIAFPGLATSSYASVWYIGQSISTRHLNYSNGLDTKTTGVYTFQTANANGIPSFNEATYPEPITRNYFGGIQNSFSFKQFQLDVSFQFVKQDAFNYMNYFPAPGTAGNEPTIVMGRWQNPGDNTNIEKFTITAGSAAAKAYTAQAQSNLGITDGSFIRLKNVAFSYELPAKWNRKIGLQHARVYLNAQNLFTITKYLGLDPETQGLSLPPLRMITIGLQVGL